MTPRLVPRPERNLVALTPGYYYLLFWFTLFRSLIPSQNYQFSMHWATNKTKPSFFCSELKRPNCFQGGLPQPLGRVRLQKTVGWTEEKIDDRALAQAHLGHHRRQRQDDVNVQARHRRNPRFQRVRMGPTCSPILLNDPSQ